MKTYNTYLTENNSKLILQHYNERNVKKNQDVCPKRIKCPQDKQPPTESRDLTYA